LIADQNQHLFSAAIMKITKEEKQKLKYEEKRVNWNFLR
jgi:hypothetical protein